MAIRWSDERGCCPDRIQDIAFNVIDQDRVGRALEEATVAGLALGNGILSTLPGVDILDDDDATGDPIEGIAEGR